MRPNILFILSDDQGVWALGCSGNPEIETPNLDTLAAGGVRFVNFFCTSPVCSPARASLITGRLPSSHGVHDWIRGGNTGEPGEAIEYLAGQIGYTDLLHDVGYRCGLSGKWHLGDSMHPQKSFDHWFVLPFGGSTYKDATMIRDSVLAETKGYLTDVITDDAVAFIEDTVAAGKPFYAAVHYTAPHSPHIDQHPADILDRYRACPFSSIPRRPKHPWMPSDPADLAFSRKLSCRADKEPIADREFLEGYFAAVTAMDRSIGVLLKTLDRLGVREQTLVCFLSDNGFNCGHHGIWGKGNVTFPLNLYDTSVKVPAIFCLPGTIPSGIVREELVSGYDLFPTICEFAGIGDSERAGRESDVAEKPGRSFLPLLFDANESGVVPSSDGHIVVYDEYGNSRMIRTHEWKYIHRYPYGPNELYHLTVDPGEDINLLDDFRCGGFSRSEIDALAMRMKSEMDEWFDRYTILAHDGRTMAVCGRGQLDRNSFHPLESSAYH